MTSLNTAMKEAKNKNQWRISVPNVVNHHISQAR